MKKIGIIIFIFALVAGVIVSNILSVGKFFSFKSPISLNFGFKRIKGSGNIVTEKREVSEFSSIDVGGSFIIEVVAQKDFAIEIEGDDNIIRLIRTEVRRGELRIKRKKRFSTKNRIKIRIFAPDIESLDISGASKISIVNIKNASLKIDSSGASTITVEGETNRLVIDTSGASKIDAANLKAVNVIVEGSGASQIYVNVIDKLSVDLSGASHVKYSGNPTNISKDTSGASSVRQSK